MLVSSTSRSTFLIVLFLSLLITGVNIVLNPLAEPEEPETKRYGIVGFSFELELGYDFNTSKLGEESLTYFEGFFFRLQNDNITLDHNLTITWRKAEPLNIAGAIIRAYNFTGEETVVYNIGSLFNATIYGHNLTYTIFTKKGYENRNGFIGYWNCSNSGRIHTLLLDAPSETANTTLLKQLFNYTVSTFVCHYPGQRPWYEESVKLPFDVQDLIEISLMVILCIGFTFTYMMEGFPNFAHTSYASMGAIASFYLVRFHGFNPYDTCGVPRRLCLHNGKFKFVADCTRQNLKIYNVEKDPLERNDLSKTHPVLRRVAEAMVREYLRGSERRRLAFIRRKFPHLEPDSFLQSR